MKAQLLTNSGSERFGHGFLGREACRQIVTGTLAPFKLEELVSGQNSPRETLTEFRVELFQPGRFGNIDTYTNNHEPWARAASISCLMSLIDFSSPRKTASAIIECPIFNSLTSGFAAIGLTL